MKKIRGQCNKCSSLQLFSIIKLECSTEKFVGEQNALGVLVRRSRAKKQSPQPQKTRLGMTNFRVSVYCRTRQGERSGQWRMDCSWVPIMGLVLCPCVTSARIGVLYLSVIIFSFVMHNANVCARFHLGDGVAISRLGIGSDWQLRPR